MRILLGVAMLLACSLCSEAEDYRLALSIDSDEKLLANNTKDLINSSDDSAHSDANSDKKYIDTVSDGADSNDGNSDNASANDSRLKNLKFDDSHADAALILAFNRMKLKEEGGKFQPHDENNHLDYVVPAANTLQLKYAAVMDNNDETEKNNDEDSDSDNDDDTSPETGKNIRPPRIFSNPKFKQIFGQNTDEKSKAGPQAVTRTFYPITPSSSEEDQQDSQEPSLKLTLGGYERPFQNESPSRKLKPASLNPKNRQQQDSRQTEDGRNMASDSNYRDQLQARFFPQQNLGYAHNAPGPFSLPQIRYNNYLAPAAESGISFRYPEYNQRGDVHNQQSSRNAVFDYNAALIEQLRNNELEAFGPLGLRNFNANFHPGYAMSTNAFALPTATDHVLRTNDPVQRTLPSPTVIYQDNSYPMFPDYSGGVGMSSPSHASMFSGNSRGSFGDQTPLDPSFLYTKNTITTDGSANGGSNSLSNSHPNSFFTQITYQPTYPGQRTGPFPNFDSKTSVTQREDSSKVAGNGEEKSESTVSQEKDGDSKLTSDNLYLNYPTKQAGYATREQLPTQSGSDTSESIKPSTESTKKVGISNTGIYGQFPIAFHGTGSPIGQHRFTYYHGRPSFPNTGSGFNSSAEKSSSNGTKGFNVEDFYRNLQLPTRFQYSYQPSTENRNFFRYPENPGNSLGGLGFQTSPSFFSGQRDNIANNSPGGALQQPESPYDFFNQQSKEENDDGRVPNCAKESNATMCFEDADYPRNQIMYSLDSDALQLIRFLSPAPSEELAGIREDAQGSDEDKSTNICKSDIRNGRPLRAINAQGKWKVVINLNDPTGRFRQNVILEKCSDIGQPCSFTDQSVSSQCVQKYSSYRLFVWSRDRGIHSDNFKLPVSCSCQITKAQK